MRVTFRVVDHSDARIVVQGGSQYRDFTWGWYSQLPAIGDRVMVHGPQSDARIVVQGQVRDVIRTYTTGGHVEEVMIFLEGGYIDQVADPDETSEPAPEPMTCFSETDPVPVDALARQRPAVEMDVSQAAALAYLLGSLSADPRLRARRSPIDQATWVSIYEAIGIVNPLGYWPFAEWHEEKAE
jgi:hypothetical protein